MGLSLDLWVIVRIVGNRWIYEKQYRKHTEPSPVLQTHRTVPCATYVAYAENKGRDPKEIDQAFLALDKYMEGISLDDNNAIFCLVCTLCDLYEKRAFQDGLQIGAYLMLELQGN